MLGPNFIALRAPDYSPFACPALPSLSALRPRDHGTKDIHPAEPVPRPRQNLSPLDRDPSINNHGIHGCPIAFEHKIALLHTPSLLIRAVNSGVKSYFSSDPKLVRSNLHLLEHIC